MWATALAKPRRKVQRPLRHVLSTRYYTIAILPFAVDLGHNDGGRGESGALVASTHARHAASNGSSSSSSSSHGTRRFSIAAPFVIAHLKPIKLKTIK